MANKQLDLGNVDSAEKAYLLGLQKADGSKPSGSIGLKIDDLELLKSLSLTFNLRDPKQYEAQDNRLSNKGFAKLAMGRYSHWFKRILGKDYSLLPDLDSSLMWSFIRGLFDGDGCISLDKRYTKKFPEGAVPGEFYMLFNFRENAETVAKFISKEANVNLPTVTTKYGMGDVPVYKIRWSGTKQLESIRALLYTDGTLFLLRKKHLFDEIRSTFRGAGSSAGGKAAALKRWKNQREDRECVFCHLTFNITKSNQQRFCSTNCGYMNRRKCRPSE